MQRPLRDDFVLWVQCGEGARGEKISEHASHLGKVRICEFSGRSSHRNEIQYSHSAGRLPDGKLLRKLNEQVARVVSSRVCE